MMIPEKWLKEGQVIVAGISQMDFALLTNRVSIIANQVVNRLEPLFWGLAGLPALGNLSQ